MQDILIRILIGIIGIILIYNAFKIFNSILKRESTPHTPKEKRLYNKIMLTISGIVFIMMILIFAFSWSILLTSLNNIAILQVICIISVICIFNNIDMFSYYITKVFYNGR